MNSSCPTPQQLALHLSGRLGAEEAAGVIAHLAECEDCREVAAESAVHLDEEEAAASSAAPAAPGPPAARVLAGPRSWRERGWRRELLAAAALLLVALGVAGVWWRSRNAAPDVETLLALAETRPGLVRFADAEFRPPQRLMRGGDGERPPWRLLAAAASIEDAAANEPGPEALHALGVARLLLGEPREAVDVLRRAQAAGPADPAIANDLGAALIHLGMVQGEPARIAEGIEALLAVPAQQRPAAAVFNEAVGYELLGKRSQAVASWERYLELDPSSQWAGEARARLDRLREALESDDRASAGLT